MYPIPADGKKFEDLRNGQMLIKLICDIQGGRDRDKVTCVEVSLGKKKDIHFLESDEKEIRKNECLKNLEMKVRNIILGVPKFICNANDSHGSRWLGRSKALNRREL